MTKQNKIDDEIKKSAEQEQIEEAVVMPVENSCPESIAKVILLEKEKAELQEKATRAIADYQNLVRRQKEEQGKIIEYAKITIFESLLQPLEHLSIAAKSLNNKGLDMVVEQFWKSLQEQGLQEYSPENQVFDPTSMEVIEKTGEDDLVIEVISPGFKLNDQIIKFAKVKVGKK